MSTIFLYVGGGLLLLAILLSMPLVKHLAKPILDSLISVLGLFFAHTGSYLVWIAKSIISAHITVLHHLMFSKKHFDPTDGLED